jgi:hypothetical protein
MGLGPAEIHRAMDLQARVETTRGFARAAKGNPDSDRGEYVRILESLYGALADVTGAHILVDSSKVPTRALLLASMKGFRVSVVHLVRDPRAIVNAWKKRMHNPGTGEDMERYSTVRVIGFWWARNLASERLARTLPYYRSRYEDLVAKPRLELARMFEALPALRGAPVPVSEDGTVDLRPLHSVSGNPHRFEARRTELRPDVQWRSTLSTGSRLLVTALTYPLAMRYGYFGP